MITFDKLKRLAIAALVADESLLSILVLKGGNAIEIAYDLTTRGSIDIDFSIEGDFSELDRTRIERKITSLLKDEFSKEDLYVFDVKLNPRPEKIKEEVKHFWGGYLLEFKIIDKKRFEQLDGAIEAIRREALALPSGSTKFTIDISKHEYVKGKRPVDLEGTVVYVYTPEMIVLEKLRALCQQVAGYREVIGSHRSKSRARDFLDIYNMVTSFTIDITSGTNLELCRHIFASKQVPLSYIAGIKDMREFHSQSWQSVLDTVSSREKIKDFDFYFDYVCNLFAEWAYIPLGK